MFFGRTHLMVLFSWPSGLETPYCGQPDPNMPGGMRGSQGRAALTCLGASGSEAQTNFKFGRMFVRAGQCRKTWRIIMIHLRKLDPC